MLRPFGWAQDRRVQHERILSVSSTLTPFALNPSTSLRTGLSQPVVSLSNQVNGEFFSILLMLDGYPASIAMCDLDVKKDLGRLVLPRHCI